MKESTDSRRNLNATPSNANASESFTAQTTKILNQVIGENHMVYKTQAVKSLTFEEVPTILYLTQGS